MEWIILSLEGRGTKSHVLFLIRASYLSCIVDFQFGSDKANFGFLGIGDGVSQVTEDDKI